MSTDQLDGQVILVSGAAGGIGAATARLLVARGATVVLADLADGPLRDLVSELGPGATAKTLDVTDLAACDRVVEEILETHGRLDVVWSNAGISAFGPAELMPPETWRKVVSVNLIGAYNLVHAALPAIIENRGHIAFTASWASFAHSPGHSAYAASKAGVEALANSLRSEVAHQGVTVGVFHPGWIATPMVTEKMDRQPAFNALLDSLPAPLRKVTPVEDVAEVLARAISSRDSKIVHPKAGWLLYALRPLLPTRLLSAGGRGAAPQVRDLYVSADESGTPADGPAGP